MEIVSFNTPKIYVHRPSLSSTSSQIRALIIMQDRHPSKLSQTRRHCPKPPAQANNTSYNTAVPFIGAESTYYCSKKHLQNHLWSNKPIKRRDYMPLCLGIQFMRANKLIAIDQVFYLRNRFVEMLLNLLQVPFVFCGNQKVKSSPCQDENQN
jgi:hypothetical protein